MTHLPDQAAEAIDAALARGISDAEAGRVMPLEEAFKRLRAELAASPADGGS